MPEPPPRTDDDVPACTPTRSDLTVPERDEHAVTAPAGAQPPGDYVDDVGEASFPASDPPSWWSGH